MCHFPSPLAYALDCIGVLTPMLCRLSVRLADHAESFDAACLRRPII
jgi:hypothetical protein